MVNLLISTKFLLTYFCLIQTEFIRKNAWMCKNINLFGPGTSREVPWRSRDVPGTGLRDLEGPVVPGLKKSKSPGTWKSKKSRDNGNPSPHSPVRIITQVSWFMYQNRWGPSGGIDYLNFVPCFVVLYLNIFSQEIKIECYRLPYFSSCLNFYLIF